MSARGQIAHAAHQRRLAQARMAYARRKKAERAAEALLTPWFTFKDARPRRIGMYRVQDDTFQCDCCWMEARWNGREWHGRSTFAPEGVYNLLLFRVKRWRGLRARPKA